MKKILLTCLMLIASVPLWAYDFVVDGIYYDIHDYNYVRVTHDGSRNGGCYSGSVTIPYSVSYGGKTYYVDAIFNEAFWNCTNLTTVSVQARISYIGARAFYNCTSLWRIYMAEPTYLETIAEEAFYNCSESNLFAGVTNAKSIGWNAFYGTNWYNNQKDGILYISESGNTICYGYKGAQPTGTLTIKEGTTTIADMAFQGCTGITNVIVPSSIKYIGGGAFSGTSWASNQGGILYSGDICLGTSGSSSTINGNLVIKEGTTKIISNAFINEEITSLTIPNSVTEIGSKAFAGCYLLTRVTIEDGATNLSGARFDDSPLESIYLGRNSDFAPSVTNKPTIKNVTIGNSLTTIGSSAFSGCTGLTEITIPTSVTLIDSYAFQGCTGLTEITIPNSVTAIGVGAFYNCTGLTEITIPTSVTLIDSYAFQGCTGLTEITIPNSVTYIGSEAFYKTSIYDNYSDGELFYVDNCLVGFKGDLYAWDKDNNGYKYLNKPQIIKDGTRLVSLEALYQLHPTEIISSSTTPPILSVYGSNYDTYKDQLGILYVPAEAYSAYWMSEAWSAVFSTIKPLTVVNSISVEVPSTCVLGDSIQLNAVVMPNNATMPTIKWSSSDPSVASVDASGLLKYLKEGKTTITASATDGSGVSTSFEIEVKTIKVSSITLDHSRLRLDVDSVATLTATFMPENASFKTAEWSVSDSNIVALTDNGNGTATIKQLAEGTAYVYVRTIDGTNLADTCEVTTIQFVEAITLAPKVITLPLYESKTITATIEPATADNKDLTWTLSNPSIAAIREDANGNCVVVMLAEGTATITATSTDGSEVAASCVVSTEALVNEITLDKTEAKLMIGETLTLNYSIGPDNAVNKNVKWISNNEKVASVIVDENGVATVTAHSSGEAIVSVFSTDGSNLIADCHIIVARGEDLPNIVTLTIKDCETGNVEVAVNKGETLDIAVNAIYGWDIKSVILNGQDITSNVVTGELFTTPALEEDSELVIVYVKGYTGEEAVLMTTNDVKVYGYDNTITIKGTQDDSVVNVYSTDGKVIYTGTERRIDVETDGVYIVTVEGLTFKLAL